MDLGLRTLEFGEKSRDIYDAVGLSWSTHRGPQGGGFGYLKFELQRKIGVNYADIGYGFEITLFKTPEDVLFHGQIRHIEEVSSPEKDFIRVTALGNVIVTQDEEIIRHFCDTRLNLWRPESELPRGSFRPDRFTFGTNTLGFYVHPSNNKDFVEDDYTEVVYEFSDDEDAKRFTATLSMVLGAGTVFDAVISAIDDVNGYIDYTSDSGEDSLVADMVVYNSTQAKQATISAVNTGTNRITVDAPGNISGWVATDEISVYGPLFVSNIGSIAAAVITYGTDTLIGEDNLANGQTLCDITKKAVATIQAFDAGANTITVTDEDHIEGWEDTDVLCIMAPYFEATFSAFAGTTLTYSSPIGERVASTATGWVLYNVNEGEYATVASWNIASNQLDVTDAGDVTIGWTNTDTLRIYTPFHLQILDIDDNVLWPESDWRQGAVSQDRTSIDVTPAGSHSGLKIRYTGYISGSGNQTSFSQLTDVKAYSTTETVTVTMLAKEMVTLLSAAGFDLNSSEDEIATVTKVIEPMVFEFMTPEKALEWTCGFGDENGAGLNWGVRLDDTKTLYLEVEDRQNIKYRIIRDGPVEASVTGDIQKSFQQIRGVYTNKLGDQQITAWQTDTENYFSDHFRRKSIKVDNVDTDAEAIAVVEVYLDENSGPDISTRYRIGKGAILNQFYHEVDIVDVKALNGITMIQDWRGVESGMSGTNIADSWTKEHIAAVEIDYDSKTVTLTPSSAKYSFGRYIAELARLAER